MKAVYKRREWAHAWKKKNFTSTAGFNADSVVLTSFVTQIGGESRFPLSFKTDGVCNTKVFLKKKKRKKKVISVKFDHVKLTSSRAAVSAGGGLAGGGGPADGGVSDAVRSWTVLRPDEVDLKGT